MTQKTHTLSGDRTAPITGHSCPYHPDDTYNFNNMSIHLDLIRNPCKRPSKDYV